MKYWFFSLLFISTLYFPLHQTADSSTTKAKSEKAVIMPMFDATLTKSTISGGPIKYGVSIPFNIIVKNNGDQTIQNIEVIDYVPDGYVFNTNGTNSIWAPSPSIMNAYETTIVGPITPGNMVTITINLILQPAALPDDWINTAEILAYQDASNIQVEGLDINPNDNSDTAFARVYDVALKKEILSLPPYYYYDTIVFRTTVFNQGNEVASQVIIQDLITEGYGFDPIANAALGWAGGVIKPKYQFTNIAIGDSAFADIKLVLLPIMADAGAWDNYAEVFQIRDFNNTVVNANEADSTPNSNSAAENAVKPGSVNDNNILGNGPSVGEDEDDHDPAVTRVLDIALKKERSTAVASYSYTQNVVFEITVYNQGNVDISQFTIVDTLTCGLDFDPLINPGWTYDASINSVRYVDSTILPAPLNQAGSSRLIPLKLGVNPCYNVHPEVAWNNYIEIESLIAADGLGNEDIDGILDHIFTNDSGGQLDTPDDNNITGNGPRVMEDEDNHDVERVDVYDLALINEIITPGPYTYGQTLDFRVRIVNQGNIITDSTEIRSHIPSGLIFDPLLNGPLGWSSVDANTVSLLYNQFVYPADTVDLILKLEVGESNKRKDWINRTYIFIARDTLGLNRGDDADSYGFGENPAEIAAVPGDASDNNIFILGPPGVGLVEDDHDVAGFFVSDLSLSKTITSPSAPYAYNTNITFNIEISNDGGNNIASYKLVDYIPCGYTFSTTGNTGWSLNTTTGYLEYNDTDGLAAGLTENISLVLTLVECNNPTTSSWINVAEISSFIDEDGNSDDFDSTPDENPDNDIPNEDDIDSTGVLIDDLSLTKNITSNIVGLSYGDPVTFNITIKNEGNVPQKNILVTDYLPCGYTFNTAGNIGWSLNTTSGNLEYTITSTMAPSDVVNIPLTVTFTSCTGQDRYVNGAEITSSWDPDNNPLDDTDSTPDDTKGNEIPNEDDYDEASLESFDLSLVKNITSNISNVKYGDPITFEIIISNEGNVDAQNIKIVEYLRCGYSFSPIGNSGWSLNNGTGYLNYTHGPTLAAGNNISIPLTLTIQECINVVNPWYNQAEISLAEDLNGGNRIDSDSTPDENPVNDNPGEDDNDDTDLEIFDLTLTKTVTNNQQYEIGDTAKYNISILNQGNVIAKNIEIVEYLPCGFSFDGLFNNGWTLGLDGYLRYTSTANLNPTASINIPLNLVIKDCGTQPMNHNNKAEIAANTDDQGGPVTDVDSTPDSMPDNDLPNEDDIDEVAIIVIIPNGNIGDYIWIDADGDGYQDSNEQGIVGATIRLYNTTWNLIATTTSGPNGFYEFTNIPAGDYYVKFSPGTDYTPTLANDTSDDKDSDITGANGPNTTDVFSLAGGQDLKTIDGGFYQCAKICGTVWYDINKNDINDVIENGINNIKVRIYKKVGRSYVFWQEKNTGHKPGTGSDDGYFEFCTNPGKYYVQVIMPPLGLVLVRPGIGGPLNDSDLNGANGTATTSSFTLASGGMKCDIKGGFYPMATFGNLIWYDENTNGVQDINETPAQGVPVTLYDDNDNIVETVTTNLDGKYEFEYLQKKEYYIEVTPPTGFSFTYANATSDDMDSDVNHENGLNTSPRFMMEPGVHAQNIDAGLSNSVLPVEWKSVEATAFDSYNFVEWTVASEINLDRYEVLRFSDKTNDFISLGMVKPNPNFVYSFEDLDVESSGYYQYKIRQFDFDGRNSDSKSVVVKRESNAETRVYPNPATSFINIDLNQDEQSSIEIINNLGQVIQQWDLINNHQKIDINHLANGKYSIKVTGKNGITSVHSFIKLK